MSEIKGFDLSRLTQDENFGFHSFAIVEFEKCKDSKITEFVNNYKVKYNVFDGSMKVSGGENVLSCNPTLSSILATQMPCRSRRSGA